MARPVLRSIRRQLFAMFAAPFVAALAIGGGAVWSSWGQRLEAERAANLEIARAISTTFLAYVDGIREQEATLADAILALDRPADATRLLEEAAERRSTVVAYAWLAPDGRVRHASDRALLHTSMAGRPEVAAVVGGADRALGNLVPSGPEGGVTFGIARAARGPDGEVAGILLAVIDPERLDDRTLGATRVGNAGFALIDAAGRLVVRTPHVARTWAERDVSRTELVQRALGGEEAAGETRSMTDGTLWIGAAVPVRRHGWVARAGRSRAEVVAPIRADAVRAAAWAALAAILAATASWAIGRHLAGGVGRLERHAAALGRGDAARRAVGGPDELDRLGRAFDDMAGRLLAANEAARRAVRHRDELLAVVSHDLRTPLGTVVTGAATLALAAEQGQVAPGAVLATARRIRTAGDRMRRMADDLVDLASLEEGRLAMAHAPHAPAELVRDAVDQARGVADEKGLALGWEVAPGVPDVDCDAGRVHQVLGNLLSNAIKATDDGRVVVRAVRAGDGLVRIEVEDTGPGIAPEELPSIFDRFRRGRDASYRGAGLGLAIARGIVEAHGGTIWAESRVGEGTRVSFTLPVAAAVARPEAGVVPARPDAGLA